MFSLMCCSGGCNFMVFVPLCVFFGSICSWCKHICKNSCSGTVCLNVLMLRLNILLLYALLALFSLGKEAYSEAKKYVYMYKVMSLRPLYIFKKCLLQQ